MNKMEIRIKVGQALNVATSIMNTREYSSVEDYFKGVEDILPTVYSELDRLFLKQYNKVTTVPSIELNSLEKAKKMVSGFKTVEEIEEFKLKAKDFLKNLTENEKNELKRSIKLND